MTADPRRSDPGNLAEGVGVIDRLHEADVALSVEAGQLRDHPAVETAG